MLRLEQPVRLQLQDRLLPLSGDVTECVGRVDINDVETQPIDGVELYLCFYQNGHSRLERLAGLGGEISQQQLFVTCPTGGAHLGGFTIY